MTADEKYTIRDRKNGIVQVNIRRDRRLRKTSRWERLTDGSLLVRIPVRMPRRTIGPMLEAIRGQLEKSVRTRKIPSDADLQQRAELINRKYFDGKIRWNAIRWVSNMQTRLGSCSLGGPSDGQIRISSKIKSWPGWVVDYVIAHELMHRMHPNHSKDFWAELRTVYPLTEKARGFIQGIGFATHQPIEEALDG